MRIEHAQILDAAEIPRFAKLGVIASMQPTHATSDMPWAAARIGDARVEEGAYVWRKLLDSGAVLASGSDFPGRGCQPDARVLRRDHSAGQRRQTAGRVDAAPAHDTRRGAGLVYAASRVAAHAETLTGSIEAGKLADLLVLSKDIMQRSAEGHPDDDRAHDDRRWRDRLSASVTARRVTRRLSAVTGGSISRRDNSR